MRLPHLPDKPMLLDLYCKAGGSARGYQRAGFHVVGVDHEPQPNYCGDEFIQADAIEFLRRMVAGGTYEWYGRGLFAAVHASPPCQRWSAYRRKGRGVGDKAPDLIAQTRRLLWQWAECVDIPFIIENVPGAPLNNTFMLCGSSFGLDVRRHRIFESNLLRPPSLPCDHAWQMPRFPAATNRRPNSRCTVEVGVYRIPLDVQKRAMGVDWDVTLDELSNGPAARLHGTHRAAPHGLCRSRNGCRMNADLVDELAAALFDQEQERRAQRAPVGRYPWQDWVTMKEHIRRHWRKRATRTLRLVDGLRRA